MLLSQIAEKIKWMLKKPKISKEEARRQRFRVMLVACPLCEKDLTGHRYALLATKAIRPEAPPSELEDFFQLCKDAKWAELLAAASWDSVLDALCVLVLACSLTNRCALLYERSPFELFESSEILSLDILEPDAVKTLLPHIAPEAWQAL